MRAVILALLLVGCERAPQPSKHDPAVTPTRAHHPVKPEHIEAADGMLTALVYLDMDLSEPRLAPDCTAAARLVELFLRNQHEQCGRMTRALSETETDRSAKTWLALHYAERMAHAASQLLQWSKQCAQEPAFRTAFARVPLVTE